MCSYFNNKPKFILCLSDIVRKLDTKQKYIRKFHVSTTLVPACEEVVD